MRQLIHAGALAALMGAAAGAALAEPAAPPTPDESKADVEMAAAAVNALFGSDRYKPFDVRFYAETLAKNGTQCVEIRLQAENFAGAYTDPQETRFRLEPIRKLGAAAPECAPPPNCPAAGTRLREKGRTPARCNQPDSPNLRAFTPPPRLTRTKRLRKMHRSVAQALFQDPSASSAIRRTRIVFVYAKADELELARETIVTLSYYAPPNGAPELEHLLGFENTASLDRPAASAMSVRKADLGLASDAPQLWPASVGPNETGWESYMILTPQITGGNREMSVTYQYFVGGEAQHWTYEGKCSDATVQDAKAHFIQHDGVNICRCTVAPGSNQCS
ncbi:hypothetical protein [Oceanicella actignis]|uniref:hypothetical protein n=1 Tax=Oceanicella actignis TaxID=1189325 RepID=UPI0011E81E70|nr:hypothetical protein [Oceanicella actignis]TYO90816.1 hypothetical protein LY05_00949 [Oceanicella actignis]